MGTECCITFRCCCLLYIGTVGFIQWIPEYTTKDLGMDISEAGVLVSYFDILYDRYVGV